MTDSIDLEELSSDISEDKAEQLNLLEESKEGYNTTDELEECLQTNNNPNEDLKSKDNARSEQKSLDKKLSQVIELNQEQSHALQLITQALLMASDKPLSIKNITEILNNHNQDHNTRVRDKVLFDNNCLKIALDNLKASLEDSALELRLVGTGYRIQTRSEFATWVQRLWQEKPSKYSKATLETLAIIAYRQPITRGEIEHIRGVAVSSNIIRTLIDREWIKVVGHKELPGKPAIYATTPHFLEDLNLEKLEDLPTLADIKEIKQDLFANSEDRADNEKLLEDSKQAESCALVQTEQSVTDTEQENNTKSPDDLSPVEDHENKHKNSQEEIINIEPNVVEPA